MCTRIRHSTLQPSDLYTLACVGTIAYMSVRIVCCHDTLLYVCISHHARMQTYNSFYNSCSLSVNCSSCVPCQALAPMNINRLVEEQQRAQTRKLCDAATPSRKTCIFTTNHRDSMCPMYIHVYCILHFAHRTMRAVAQGRRRAAAFSSSSSARSISSCPPSEAGGAAQPLAR